MYKLNSSQTLDYELSHTWSYLFLWEDNKNLSKFLGKINYNFEMEHPMPLEHGFSTMDKLPPGVKIREKTWHVPLTMRLVFLFDFW